jgi:hypothetical protein
MSENFGRKRPKNFVVRNVSGSNGAVWLKLGFYLGVVDVPEIAAGIHKFNSYFDAAALLGADVNDATFALFLGEAIYYENRLPLLEFGGNRQASAMGVHIERMGLVTEGEIAVRASIDDDGNMQRKSAASADVSAEFRLIHRRGHPSSKVTL